MVQGKETNMVRTSPWWLPGALLVLFGITVMIMPELLAWMVASAFIFAGVSWLAAAWTARKQRRNLRVFYFDRW
jgi:uncharacterized membrane protein HdeD (DUF308 family)